MPLLWPALNAKLTPLIAAQPTLPVRTDGQLLEEILETLRSRVALTDRLNQPPTLETVERMWQEHAKTNAALRRYMSDLNLPARKTLFSQELDAPTPIVRVDPAGA
jgi:hypothetical protein